MGVKVREHPKGSGKFYIFINHKGQRRAKFISYDKKAALEVARKVEARLTLGDLAIEPKQDKVTLKEYSEKWLRQVSATRKYATYYDYHTTLKNYVWPVFGQSDIKRVRRDEVRDLVLGKLESLSPSTVMHIIRVLRAMYNEAIEDGIAETNPAMKLGRLIKVKRTKENLDPFTVEEQRLILRVSYDHDPRLYPLYLIAFRAGLRQSELLTLKPEDLDFHHRFIYVRRNLSRRVITTPKSGEGRKVDMSLQVAEVLKHYLLQRKKETLARGWGETPEWLFYNSEGKMLDASRLRKSHKRILDKAGVRYRNFHNIRHTFVVRLLEKNESLAYIKDQCGHSSIQVTVDIYGHLIPGSNKRAVDSLDDWGATYAQLVNEKGVAEIPQPLDFIGGPPGARTPDLLIKSQLLYQLS